MSGFFVTALAYRGTRVSKSTWPRMQCAITSCKACARICPSWLARVYLYLVFHGQRYSLVIPNLRNTYYFRKAFHAVEKKKLRSCVAMLSRFPVSSRNAKEKCNDINCEEADLLRLWTSCAGKTGHARRQFFVSKSQYFLNFKYIQI